MSEKWETVGKKKDRGSKLPVPKANSIKEVKPKKNELNGVRIEEVLPKSQVQNLYANTKSNKENKKPQEKNKVQDASGKKPQKKEKQQDAPKPKPPKSIESALNQIDVEEFKSIFEKNKNFFPDNPIVWLKELVQFLNLKVPIDTQDPVFSNKPAGYPLNIVPPGVKNVIEKSLTESGKGNIQTFFDICLTSMVTDMGKGLPGVGYKFYLQCIAINEPNLVVSSLNKHINLRNSYQNRSNIGLSILWAVGNVGISDVHSGLTVFQELFLPLLDMKNYSNFVAKYLSDLIKQNGAISLSKEEYLLILDTVHSNKKNVPTNLKQILSTDARSLKPLLFKNNKEKYHTYVELFFKKIVMNSNKSYQDCLCDVLIEVFAKDPTTLANWNKLYPKNVAASAVLLSYIGDNWQTVHKKLNKSAIKDLLNNFKVTNDELSLKKRKEEGLKDSIAALKVISEKMVVKNKSSIFPLKKVLFLIILATTGIVYLDIKQQGSWKESTTHKFFKEYGVCDYVNKGIGKSKEGFIWVDSRIEENFPGYHKTMVDFSTPYIQLFSDLSKIVYNALCGFKEIIIEKYPIVLQTVDSYAPGVIEQSQKAVTNVYSTSLLYYTRGVDYLRKEIFIGQLSPENVQKVVIGAFNTTQQKATEYYHWIYEKVQTTIK